MSRTAVSAILAVILPLLAASCDADRGIDGEVPVTDYDLVTFNGYDSEGLAAFSLVGPEDTGTTPLRARMVVDTAETRPGDRLLIAYTAAGDNGLVSVAGMGTVTNVPLRAASARTISAMDGDPVYLLAMWRTGTWLNMRAGLPYSREPRSWGLVADSAYIDTPMPVIRLVHRLPGGVSADSTWTRTGYTSCDIAGLWNRHSVNGVKVVLDNSNLTLLDTIIFNKP